MQFPPAVNTVLLIASSLRLPSYPRYSPLSATRSAAVVTGLGVAALTVYYAIKGGLAQLRVIPSTIDLAIVSIHIWG